MDSQTSSGPLASSGLTAQLTAKAPLLLGIALVQATLILYFGSWVWGGAASGVFSDFQAFWVAGRYLSGGGDAALLYEAPRFIAAKATSFIMPSVAPPPGPCSETKSASRSKSIISG